MYVPQTWADGPNGGTPITAARLENIEDGVSAIDAAITHLQQNGGGGTGGAGVVWGANVDATNLADGTFIAITTDPNA